jgi:hypothetical protein
LKTTLDDAHSWFLRELRYAGELRIVLAEGITASESEDIKIGDHVIKGTRALEPRAASRIVLITFARVVAWQLVDESFTAFDDYEAVRRHLILADLISITLSGLCPHTPWMV